MAKKFKTIIFLLMLSIFIWSDSVLAEVYWIELFTTKDGKIILDESVPEPVKLRKNEFFVREWSQGNYQAKIFSFKNELLDQIYFYPYNIIFYDMYNPKTRQWTGGTKIIKTGGFLLTLPYYPNAKYVEIFNDKGEKQLTIDVSKFAVCNENGICEKGEDEKNCPQDCQEKATSIQPENYQGPSKSLFYNNNF
jgi:hypothetical protein